MVQTRRQWINWANRGFPSQSSQGSCNHCSQQSSQQSNHSFDNNAYDDDMNGYYNEEAPREEPARYGYRPNDHCKRHRIDDGQPKTEEVSTYRRREPRR